jgi:pimeloyl-ACP methyl ester carboxylesterase
MIGRQSESIMSTPKVSRFRSAEHKARFDAAYDQALRAWPLGTTTAQVSTAFGTTCVHACGPTNGPPIVLLHGVAVASPSWFATATLLGQHRRVYAVDTITDAGRSHPIMPIPTADALADWLDQVLANLDSGGAHLVGLSYGGWLALHQAVRRPDRVLSAVAVDPPLAFGLPPLRRSVGMVPDALRAKLRKGDEPIHRLLARMNGGTPPAQPVLDLSVTGLRSFRLVQPRPGRFTSDQLRSIRIPILLMVGDHSPVNVPRRVCRAAATIPGAVTEIVAGAGHAIPLDTPDAFAARVRDFIAGVEQPGQGSTQC